MAVLPDVHLRVARPTDHMDEVVHFYQDGLGLQLIGSFDDHEGFDGVILGQPGQQYHLEFTRKRGHAAGRAPTADNLLVFYLSGSETWATTLARMESCGYVPVAAFNPYWERNGTTFEDPDGYRIVLAKVRWSQ